MAQAYKNARANFKYFWRELIWERQRIVPALVMANVKVCCEDPPELAAQHGRGAEHMWLSDAVFDGKTISGTLLNQPNWLVSFKDGQQVKLSAAKISDWMYVYFDDKVHGAFSVQVLRSRMGKRERKQHDAAWGLDFGEPDAVRIIPDDWNPLAAVLKKKGFFAKLSGKTEPPPKADYQAIEHPMSLNMVPKLEEHLQETPDMLTQTDELGWTLLHRQASAGSTTLVKTLLKHGADTNAKSTNGLTALQIAKGLGWRDVTKLLSNA